MNSVRFITLVVLVVTTLACASTGTSSRSAASPTATTAPTQTPTRAAVTFATDTPPAAFRAAPTRTPTPTVLDQIAKILPDMPTATVLAESLNVRSGPGVDYDVVTQLDHGVMVSICGCNEPRDWVQITFRDISGWVSTKYLDITGDLTRVAVAPIPDVAIPSPAPTVAAPTPTSPATPAPPPTASGPDCICSRDAYNCDDAYANHCFTVCRQQGAGDVHRLDRDNDGDPCESQ